MTSGYGHLEDKLINLLCSGKPDFDAAKELIKQGADINSIGQYDDENVLSEILMGYRMSYEYTEDPDYIGKSICEIIRFFLSNGFDLNKCDGCFGAQCLDAVTYSTYDRYMIDATKILLDGGARNRTISPNSTDEEYTPMVRVADESSYLCTCERDYALSNIFDALYQIYQAIEDGKPYSGIDSYEVAINKKILKVYAEKNGDKTTFFHMNLSKFKKDNCFKETLYFVYDGGVLIVTQYEEIWTDISLPKISLVDVSEHFESIIGSNIIGFSYDYREIVKGITHYDQSITFIELDSGYKLKISMNFGEVKKEDRAAYYEIICENDVAI